MERETVLVLDFGSQYTHLIARRIRELHVYSEIVPFNVGLREIKAVEPKGVVFSGGPDSVYVENAPLPEQEVLEWLLENNVPILGICYGHQLLALLLGGVVKKGGKGEYGRTRLTVIKGNELFSETPREQVVWMSHRDYVETPPPGAEILASTENSPVAAFKLGDKPVYGVQFHPEVRHTKHGLTILKNFLYTVCKCKGEWVVENLAGQLIGEIRREAPEGNILMAVSGGVDSTTAAYLIKEAVGPDRIHLIIIDTGLLREREAEEALNLYKTLGFKYIHLIDAKKEFLEALKGVTDPEEKRMIISRIYFKILDETSSKLASIYGDFEYLG
ncbi:MAG: GMP synthase (glutamine-hydrolyzing), partial [Thermoprotei archaeon]